jgi:branched-chain amino acid transport system ATP-binding protein
MATLREKGFTVVLVEQNFHFAANLADRHYVVDHGVIAEMITKEELPGSRERLNRILGV